MKSKCFRGIIFYKNRSLLLSVCSRSLYRLLKGKRASVKQFRNGTIILKRDTKGTKFQIASNEVVQIAVTKYFKNHGIRKLPVKAYFQGFKIEDAIQNIVALKSSIYHGADIPKKIYWVKAFLRNTKRGMKITLHRKAIAELAGRASVRVLFQRTSNGIILRKSSDVFSGRKLYSYTKAKNNSHVTEIAYPKELKNKFSGYVGIPIEEFKIRSCKFAMNQLEGDLLEELERSGLNVQAGTTQTLGDILLPNSGYVEVTNFNPKGRRDSRHSSIALQIRGKLFEAEHMSVHRKIKPIFIVLNRSWMKNNYFNDELEEAKKLHVYTIFSDFKNNWVKYVSNDILLIYSRYS